MLHMMLFNLSAFYRFVDYTCELTNESGYKSYSMAIYEISSIYTSIYIGYLIIDHII